MPHVTFIHGIGNKPEAEALLGAWKRRLAYGTAGIDLDDAGVEHSMVCWADVLYESPDPNIAAYEKAEDALVASVAAPEGPTIAPAPTLGEAAFMAGVAAKLGGTLAAVEAVEMVPPDRTERSEARPGYERVPLPWPLKRLFLERFLRDVHHYLFNVEFSPRQGTTYRVQDEIRRRFVAQLAADGTNGRPHVVVSHSLGTVIAYDCLKRVPDCPAIDGLITLGSPLGLDEVQDRLQPGWTRADGFPGEKVSGAWANLFDRLDPVAGFDPFLANDFRAGGAGRVEDVPVVNEESAWRHSAVLYLQRSELRGALRRMLRL